MMANPVRKPVQIGQVIQRARQFNPSRWGREKSTLTENLPANVQQLFNRLAEQKIHYVLVGDIAMLSYVAGRNTDDIDLIIDANDLSRLKWVDIVSQDENFARSEFAGLQIDFLLTNNKLFQQVYQHYCHPQPFDEQTITTATIEGLILLKLFALPSLYRQGDFTRVGLYENDIATLMQIYQPAVAAILSVLAEHLTPTDMTEVCAIMNDISGRIQRFQNRSTDD